MQVNSISRIWESVNGWFTPAEIAAVPIESAKMRMFLVLHLLGPLLVLPISILLLVSVAYSWPAWVINVAVCVFFSMPIVHKFTAISLTRVNDISIQNFVFIIFFTAFHYGGYLSPFLTWLLVLPFVGAINRGVNAKPSRIIYFQIAIGLACFVAAYFWVGGFASHTPMDKIKHVALISNLAALSFMFLFANYYTHLIESRSGLIAENARHRQTLAKLTAAKNEAEKANQAKSEFLTNMSHELRTPLNAVIGYGEMLVEEAQYNARTQEVDDLKTINSAGKHLLSLVDDVLDLAKIEARQTQCKLETFPLKEFFRELESTARLLATKGANNFVAEKTKDLGEVTLDKTMLRQVVLNLLSNAAKFTESGQITLTVERFEQDQSDWISIAVEDTGIGIAEKNLDKLFQNFSQAEPSIPSQYGGTGLGLSISRKLCQLLGGDIEVHSVEGEGSCFTINIPAIAVAHQSQKDRTALDFEYELDAIDQSSSLEAVMNALKRDIAANSDDSAKRKTVVIVSNDNAFVGVLAARSAEIGFRCVSTSSPDSVLQLARTLRPVAVIFENNQTLGVESEIRRVLESDASTRHIASYPLSIPNFGEQEKDDSEVQTTVDAPFDDGHRFKIDQIGDSFAKPSADKGKTL